MHGGKIDERKVAYFSMEIGFDASIPTYAGGLGMLAGDTVRSAADMRVPMVAVTLLHRGGYFFQRIDEQGWQSEEPAHWPVIDLLVRTEAEAVVEIEGRSVTLHAWRYNVRGEGSYLVPVYLLDSDLPENSESDRALTSYLYGGDERYRLCQEVVLGIGGVRILRALGYTQLLRFHMNEGHAALLTLELLREHAAAEGRSEVLPADLDDVRSQCVFTTHTPVPAGHDQYDLPLVRSVLGDRSPCGIHDPACQQNRLNLTYLALSMSRYINGVAKKHADVSRHMFAEYTIDAITNGVRAATWVAPPLSSVYDEHIPGWRQDNFSLRYALSIDRDRLWNAHQEAKRRLLQYVQRESNCALHRETLTLGFARRAATYKRAGLIFEDFDRLRQIARDAGGLQLIFAGKAHPKDNEGKLLIQSIIQAGRALEPDVVVAYLPNYDMSLASLMVSGVDVWLNTPRPPLEASGTSGMKAALNGVPSLSVLDGWWIEGCIEGITGWGIASDGKQTSDARDAAAIYNCLSECVQPMYHDQRQAFIDMMRHCIALNGSFFNTQRMVQQYVVKAYFE